MSSAREGAPDFSASSNRKTEFPRRARRGFAGVLACALAVAAGCATIRNPATSQTPAATASSAASASPNSRLKSALGKMPLYFIENRGQVDARAAYYLRGKDKSLYFTSEGITFVLTGANRQGAPTLLRTVSIQGEASEAAPVQSTARWVLKLDFVGADGVMPRGEEPTRAGISYFKGSKDQWKTGLKSYSKLVYADLWPGIDLVYGGTSDRIKYMFVVKPGADVNQIQLAYRGASSISVNEKQELEIETPAGSFHDDQPYAYQEIAGKRVEVPMAYLVQPDGEKTGRYGFRVGSYDRKQPLVLDPAILIYAGFIGGLADDRGNGVAVDSDGSAYVTGETGSDETTFPDTAGAFDRTQNGGVDAFVAKVKADGTGLDYATFIGGAGDDRGNAIALAQGCAPPCEAYITGETSSDETTFPVTSGAFDETHNGGIDAFVARVNAAGTDLVYATYIGGAGTDRGKGIAVEGTGDAHVTGETNSSDASFPDGDGFGAIPGADQTDNGGFDAFVAKLMADGSGLIHASYIGGSGDDRGNAIALEPACVAPCAAYITGETSSDETTFPETTGAFDETHNGGIDAFVAKVNTGGTALDYAGYIGGSGTDRGKGIAADAVGKAYVAGETSSDETTFPDGAGVGLTGPDVTHNGGIDAFVAKVSTDGTSLEYAGYIGGSGDDSANAIAIEPSCAGSCAAYVAGETTSDQLTFPDTVGPDLTHNGGVDAFVAKVKDDGTELLLAGYIGSSGDDRGNAIAADDSGAAYVAGETNATQAILTNKFPVKTGPDKSQNGAIDAFVAKLCTAACVNLTLKKVGSPKSVLPGGTITYTLTISNKGPDDATDVTIVDTLPVGAIFVPPAVPSAGSCGITTPVTCNVGTLVKGASATVTITITAPGTTGTIVNTATVSSNETDTNPDKNEASAKTKVLLPDLVIKKIVLSLLTVVAGGSIDVTDTTSNKKSVGAGASTTSFYLSIDKVFDGGDTFLDSRAVGTLDPKEADTALVPTNVTIPLASPCVGTCYIIAVADDGNAVNEDVNEGNNTKAKKITVTP